MLVCAWASDDDGREMGSGINSVTHGWGKKGMILSKCVGIFSSQSNFDLHACQETASPIRAKAVPNCPEAPGLHSVPCTW